ncbi:PEP-CTERM sorting domain-containing protein [Colwelliaceae bacterium 6441]
MYLIKNILKSLSAVALFTCTQTFAGDLVPLTTLTDEGSDHKGGYEFDIDNMEVRWTESDQISLSVNTNFLNFNNQKDTGTYGTGNIVFGDLFLTTYDENGVMNQFAFVLSDLIRNKSYLDPVLQNHTEYNAGGLYRYQGGKTAKEYHGMYADVADSSTNVVATPVGSVLTSGDMHVFTQYSSDGFDQLTFDFNVDGISAFESATQLSLRWAMTCANDIADGTINIVRGPDNTTIPEPQTLLLMLLGLAGIAYRRKNTA